MKKMAASSVIAKFSYTFAPRLFVGAGHACPPNAFHLELGDRVHNVHRLSAGLNSVSRVIGARLLKS
jgi:hypothetical protein